MYQRFQYFSDPLLTEANLSPLLTGKSLNEQLDETYDRGLLVGNNFLFGSPHLSDLSTCLTDAENTTFEDGNDNEITADLIGSDSEDWDLSNQSWISNRIFDSNTQTSNSPTKIISYQDENSPGEDWNILSPTRHLTVINSHNQHYLRYHNHHTHYADNCSSCIDSDSKTKNVYSLNSINSNLNVSSARHNSRSRIQKRNVSRRKNKRLQTKYPIYPHAAVQTSTVLMMNNLQNPISASPKATLNHSVCLKTFSANRLQVDNSGQLQINSCPKLRSTRQRRCPARYWQSEEDPYVHGLRSNMRQSNMRTARTRHYLQHNKTFFNQKEQPFSGSFTKLSQADEPNPRIDWLSENSITDSFIMEPATNPWSSNNPINHLPTTVLSANSSLELHPNVMDSESLTIHPRWTMYSDANILKPSDNHMLSTLIPNPSLTPNQMCQSPKSNLMGQDPFHILDNLFESEDDYLPNEVAYSPIPCYDYYSSDLELQSFPNFSPACSISVCTSASSGHCAQSLNRSMTASPASSMAGSTATTGRNSSGRGRKRHLLQFIVELLLRGHGCVEWVSETDRIFHITHPEQLTRLWGKYKNNTGMTFDSLSRSLRLYYAPGKLERIQGRKHQYRILALDVEDF